MRLVEMTLPRDVCDFALQTLRDAGFRDAFAAPLDDQLALVRVVASPEAVEPLLEMINRNYEALPEFRAWVLEVEAVLPREEEEPKAGADPRPEPGRRFWDSRLLRMSREELYTDVSQATVPNLAYVVLVVLSVVVATVGMVRGSQVVVLGAMVIAPLLSPNVALAMATTLGDGALALSAVASLAVGTAAAVASAAAFGLFLQADPGLPEIASRTYVTLSDVVLALASGAAGALAMTTGMASALVGVMVAVALLPPLTACGLLLGSGHAAHAWRAALLFCANLIGINLSCVLCFWVMGIRPSLWWEEEKARNARIWAALVWAALMVLLLVLIWHTKTPLPAEEAP